MGVVRRGKPQHRLYFNARREDATQRWLCRKATLDGPAARLRSGATDGSSSFLPALLTNRAITLFFLSLSHTSFPTSNVCLLFLFVFFKEGRSKGASPVEEAECRSSSDPFPTTPLSSVTLEDTQLRMEEGSRVTFTTG